ncbi:outer membrane protein assembly factor BamB family protein [Streptosporangium sp. NBC_01756]|uniref:outer membrane protein assembly factor BamB family protein n=1 Tax=Streptosporangium sp. NBC_01756 TaxID=2975950 RepID=UPI002DD938C3|nr:PQQ-binding-like beta-propeller repeat protein [Streptosporangium sp. NBC_01756]WSC88067.1 PQQ-like beta-propeller repeat protein [Streptosporangium sp. NBC_01756]
MSPVPTWWNRQMIGKTLWERQLHQRGSASALAVTEALVVVHERHTRLVCLDRHDCSVRWDVPIGTWPRAVVVAGDRCLVLPQDTDQLFCLDLTTGSAVWRAGLPQYSGHVVATAETVVVGGWRGYTPMLAFNVKDGRLLWRTQRRVATVRPLSWNGGMLLGEGSEAWSMDPRDGTELDRWRLPEPSVETDDRPAFTMIGPDRCLVPCGPRSVASIRLSSGLVERFFHHDADLSSSAAEFIGGVVWLRERGAGYLAVDPGDGSVLWNVDVGQPLVGGVVRDGEGFVVASAGGVLFRLRSDGHILERSLSATRVAALRDLGAGKMLMVTKGTLRMISIDHADEVNPVSTALRPGPSGFRTSGQL